MCAEHNKNEEAIFNAAIEIDSPAERAAFIKSACGDDTALLARVEALLKVHFEDESFLKSPPGGIAGTLDAGPLTEGPGTRIGRYKLLQLIGEGGFGVVYMAEQEEPIVRRVALKIIKLGMDTKQVIARFEAERQALAMMDHPNIARVFDAGATDTGRPYFVMELVKGIPITEYCDKNNLDTRQRLELFIDVCKAVQHAHQKGIIHRDIKPSNVMITLHDSKAVPKIIDFGIAKATQHRLTEKTLFTEYRQFIGTPEYMSPEQAEMSGLDVDTRTDIYSLGVLLYELLTGTTPFEADKLRSAAYDEIRRIIREDEPPKPSTRLSTLGEALTDIAKRRDAQPGELCKIVRGDLDWVVMKTIEKDRIRRYETANELAMDIERHLGDEPVSAGPPSVRYRLHKFVRRHRTGVAAGLLVAAAIVAGLAVSTTMYFQAEQAREKENAARVMAEQAREIETIARKQAEQAKEGEIKQRQLTEKEKEKTRKLLYSTQIALVGSELKNENTANAKRLLQECPEDLRNWEYDYLKYISDQSQMTLRGHAGGVQRVVFTPDGKRLISGGRDGTIRKWNIATGTELMKIDAHEYYITSIKINPNGKQIASSSPERTVKLWDLDNGNLIHTLNGHTGYVYCVDFSPDGKRLASCSSDSTVRVWDVNAAEEILLLTIPNRKIASVAFSPDGKKLVAVTITGSDGNRFIKVWDSVTGKLLKEKSESDFGSLGVSHFWDLEFDKEGKNILTANWGRALVWDAETLEIKKFISQTHRFGSRRAVFSPDGKQIVTGGVFGPLKIWSSSNGELIRTLHGHVGDIWSIAYSPDGTLIVSGSEDGTIKVWDAAVDYEKIILDGAGNPVQTVCFNSDGTLLASGTTDNLIRIWSTEEWKVLHILFGHSDSITSTNFSPDSRYVVSGSSDNTIKIWRADTGELLKTLKGHLGSVTSVQYSVNGEHIVSSSEDNTIRIWDSETGECKMMLTEHKGGVTSVRYTTDGKYLISGSDDKTVRIWNSKTGECLLTLTGHKKGINRIAVSPNDRWIVSSDPDIAIIWDKETGKQMSSFQEPSDNITDVIFSIDSKRIFSSSEDDIIRIWETETGRCILTLVEFQTGGIQALSVSPNGKTIAAGANWFGNMVILSSQYSKKYVERKTSEAHMEYETYLGLLELEKDPQKIPRQAKLFAGHHYFFCPKLMAWKEAKEYAEFVGGHLATITSKEENDWIIQTFSHLFNYWLGGTDEDEEGRWKWITGEEWKYSSWAKGEPGNQNGNEHSLKMYSNGLWNDNLSEIHFYFLIEWEY